MTTDLFAGVEFRAAGMSKLNGHNDSNGSDIEIIDDDADDDVVKEKKEEPSKVPEDDDDVILDDEVR